MWVRGYMRDMGVVSGVNFLCLSLTVVAGDSVFGVSIHLSIAIAVLAVVAQVTIVDVVGGS